MKKITENQFSQYYQLAIDKKLITEDDDSIIFIDTSIIDDRLNTLRDILPPYFLQATAIKSNPLTGILKHLKSAGSGFECASISELYLALNTQIDNAKIVLDSPAIRRSDITDLHAKFQGGNINVNSLSELSRYSKEHAHFNLGLRINPLVNDNKGDYFNVSSNSSKFGEPISNTTAIINALLDHPSVNTLHVHVGSQNADTQNTVNGIRKVIDLANEINQQQNGKIKIINIGGGFPVNYAKDADYEIKSLFEQLRAACPELFNEQYKVITEFGRYIHANAGWLVSRIEQIKTTEHAKIAIINVGADMFLRECYSDLKLSHNIRALDSKGINKTEAKQEPYSIAGPLCFAGDFIAYDYPLPALTPDDHIVIEDIGANTFSLWSRHCSRPFPKVIAYNADVDGSDMAVIKEKESYSDILKFWT